MINVLIAGVGGQGTVLAAKLLATAAADKGWKVRTAETIGMAQRGGSVISHVRMGDLGEEVLAPLIPRGCADLLIGFEPGEAARALPYLARDGMVVTAMSTIQPVTSSLSGESYSADEILHGIQTVLYNASAKMMTGKRRPAKAPELICVDDKQLLRRLGAQKRMLNTVMLASALSKGRIPLSVEDLREAIPQVVKPQFVTANLRATEV
ncbi:MAG: pyruvate ferredoxin oxidoreductase [Eggerthellaceae bacterium]|nr:pyruvate ferredoxin oxidoreductase [Eggerthellaceae bacterium]